MTGTHNIDVVALKKQLRTSNSPMLNDLVYRGVEQFLGLAGDSNYNPKLISFLEQLNIITVRNLGTEKGDAPLNS